MKNQTVLGFACRHCHHYEIEGRRGGHCQQLGSSVHGHWRACPFYIAPFAPTWEIPLCQLDRAFLKDKDNREMSRFAIDKSHATTSLQKGLKSFFPKDLLLGTGIEAIANS